MTARPRHRTASPAPKFRTAAARPAGIDGTGDMRSSPDMHSREDR